MRIAIGADHRGLVLKPVLIRLLEHLSHEVLDMGADEFDPDDDYPDFAQLVAQEVVQGRADRGVLLCGSGVGASVASNKIKGIRAGVCHDAYSARQGVEHDDMNVICLGSAIVGEELAKELVTNFVSAEFNKQEVKYQRRLDKVLEIEDSMSSQS